MPDDKNFKQSFMRNKPKGIKGIPIPTVHLGSKEDLRDLITDYILRNIEEDSKGTGKKKIKRQIVQYPTIPLKINVNGEDVVLNFQFVMILQKYLHFEKKNIYRQERIEPLIVDILNFLDVLEETTSNISFQIDTSHSHSIEDEVMVLLIEKHHKDKQKKCRLIEFEQLRKRIIAKHTRISFIDLEDHLKKKEREFLLEINEFDQRKIQNSSCGIEIMIPEKMSKVGSKLTQLIHKNEVFQNSAKLQQLKKEKLLEFYKSNEIEYLNKRAEVTEDLTSQFSKSSTTSKQCLQFIQDWITDINLSEKYFQTKFGRADKKMPDIDKQEIFIEDSLLIQ